MTESKRRRFDITEDIWNSNDDAKNSSRRHPSQKRNKKTPMPHPGQSYNPDPEDHQKLLKKVAEKELKHLKKEASLKRAVRVKVNKKELMRHEKAELHSGIEHLIKPEEDSKNFHSDSDTDDAYGEYDEKDFAAILKDKKVLEKRKSRQQRLRQIKDKLQRKAAKLKKLKNIRLSKIDAIKKITKELDKKEKEISKVKKSRKKKNERLGQSFEESDPIYCLSSELPKNLREVRCPMDSIVRQQLESFQSRLLVEPTKLQIKKRKYKKRQYERSQEDELEV